jgi:outer membrane protein assembly factor BamA
LRIPQRQIVRLSRQAVLLLTSVLLSTALAWAESAPGGEQRRIREVRIEIAPIYSEEKAEESSWAAFTNRYHIRTRESVVRNELLFKEGDVLDGELLEASERALRRFKFLNKAEVLVKPIDDQTVDVEVRTKEAWTLEPGVNVKGGGGLATVSAHLIEFNLLGYGKKLYAEAIYENDVGTTWKYGYSDYQLFNSRWIGNATYQKGPLIESYFAQARLPLYSPDSMWSYGGSVYDASKIVRLFEDGEESSRFAKDQTQLSSFMTRSFGARNNKTNLKLALKYLKIDYSDLGPETTTPPPPDQSNVTPTVGLNTGYKKWAKNTYINKMGITEDDWLGLRYGGTIGYGIPLENSLELWDVRTFLIKNIALSPQQLLKLNGSVDSEVVRNTFVKVSARYYKNFTGHTLATRFTTNIGYEVDSSRQLQLGADSGLRGYPARQFTGEKLVLMNLEDRQFWGSMSMGPKLAIGTVVFLDAGNVWKDEEDVELNELNWSAGVGFRIGISNMPKQPIVRVDLGWALGGEDSFAVTVGAEQHFR